MQECLSFFNRDGRCVGFGTDRSIYLCLLVVQSGEDGVSRVVVWNLLFLHEFPRQDPSVTDTDLFVWHMDPLVRDGWSYQNG